jgi:hypothetical protein
MFEELKFRSFTYKATMPDPGQPAKKHTRVTIALMGSDAGLYGAARLPMLSGTESQVSKRARPGAPS